MINKKINQLTLIIFNIIYKAVFQIKKIVIIIVKKIILILKIFFKLKILIILNKKFKNYKK